MGWSMCWSLLSHQFTAWTDSGDVLGNFSAAQHVERIFGLKFKFLTSNFRFPNIWWPNLGPPLSATCGQVTWMCIHYFYLLFCCHPMNGSKLWLFGSWITTYRLYFRLLRSFSWHRSRETAIDSLQASSDRFWQWTMEVLFRCGNSINFRQHSNSFAWEIFRYRSLRLLMNFLLSRGA